tara:strand:- start:16 stop:411 length:396 start_codon:yes stop_codon:yes gene_type:complete
MFTKEQLEGILLSLPKPEIHVSRDDRLRTGYKVRLRLNFRGSSDFLLGLKRTFAQYNIETQYKEEEHKARPLPILRVSGATNIYSTIQLVPDLPDAKGNWEPFKEVFSLYENGQHLTQEGLERILEIKGVI